MMCVCALMTKIDTAGISRGRDKGLGEITEKRKLGMQPTLSVR